jgi:hypothetical protein
VNEREYTAPDGVCQAEKHGTDWGAQCPSPAPAMTREEIDKRRQEIGAIPNYDRKAYQELFLDAEDWPLQINMIMYVRRGTAGRPIELIAYSAGSA